jgi:hypothetical protein
VPPPPVATTPQPDSLAVARATVPGGFGGSSATDDTVTATRAAVEKEAADAAKVKKSADDVAAVKKAAVDVAAMNKAADEAVSEEEGRS